MCGDDVWRCTVNIRDSTVNTASSTASSAVRQPAAHIAASSWIATAEAGLDSGPSLPPPSSHPLQDVADLELQQLRQADMSAPHYDPDWD